MIRAKTIFHIIRERDLIHEAKRDPLREHLKIEYQRNINKYFKQTK